jgi:hypothetical protein
MSIKFITDWLIDFLFVGLLKFVILFEFNTHPISFRVFLKFFFFKTIMNYLIRNCCSLFPLTALLIYIYTFFCIQQSIALKTDSSFDERGEKLSGVGVSVLSIAL